MLANTSKPDQQIISCYELINKIAEGGMGTVYKGRHQTTGEIVAIKLVSPHMANNAVFLKRFQNEFRAAQKLDHPNVVRAIEYGISNGRPYLVMEFVEGESLGQRVERDGRILEAEAIQLIASAAEGLLRAHEMGLIHRDVKPDNIMVTPDGHVKLADLGLVKELDGDVNLTRTGRGLGTPHFMAPEQFRDAKNADVRCDVYSLGATLYMLVTGKMPFQALGPLEAWLKKQKNDLPPPRKLVPELSEKTDALIQRAMDADPARRHSSCKEFIQELKGERPSREATTSAVNSDPLWYLVYKDQQRQMKKGKATTSGIRRSLIDGFLGNATGIWASRTKTGSFEPLSNYPEFADLPLLAAKSPAENSTPTPVDFPPTQADSSSFDRSLLTGRGCDPTPPLIPLQTLPSPALEWAKIVLWVLLAIASGIVAALLF